MASDHHTCCVPVLVDHVDCPTGRQNRAFLRSADVAESAKLEWAVGFVALIVVGFVARHDSKVVAARDAST
jgi:hypothetical protein